MTRLAAVTLALAVVLSLQVSPSQASCAAPQIEVSPTPARPGAPITVTGKYFADGCNDTGGCSSGLCTTTCEQPAPEPPLTGLSVELRRAATVLDSVTVDADERYRIAASLTVPTDAPPGRYGVYVVKGEWEAAATELRVRRR